MGEKDPSSSLTLETTSKVLRDPRSRPPLLPPPPPRLSTYMADRIQVSDDHAKSSSGKKPSGISATSSALKNGNKHKTPPSSSSWSSLTVEIEGQQLTSPSRHMVRESASRSPYSPCDTDELAKNDGEEVTSTKVGKKQCTSSKDVIDFVSTELKTREECVEKYRKKFSGLRKYYDQKKAELGAAQEQLKEFRKQVQVLSSEKSAIAEQSKMEKEQLEDTVKSLQLEISQLKDEKEAAIAKATKLSTLLNCTRAEVDEQKRLYAVQTTKLANLEKKNLELKQMSRQETIVQLRKRIQTLENAMMDDVQDKNTVVSALNLFMAKSQRRVGDIFNKENPVKGMKGEGSSGPGSFLALTPDISNFKGKRVENSNVSASTVTGVGGESIIKAEKLSSQKRKEMSEDDEDNNSDIVILTPPSNSSQHKRQRFK